MTQPTYAGTVRNASFAAVLTALREWGDRSIYGESSEPVVLEHDSCGSVAHLRHSCAVCGEELDAGSVTAKPGPGAPR